MYYKNNNLGKDYKSQFCFSGPQTDSFPSALSKVPFVWDYFTQKFDYEFIAGLIGVSQDDNMVLRQEIGWAIREKKE
jgi:hypothetical protein